MIKFPKIEGLIMSVTAVMLGLVLVFSVVARYHHHGSQGDVHYCLVCDFDDTENHDDCWDFQANGCCGDHGSKHDDNSCALHIDSFYHNDSHHSCKHHCSVHYVCGCLSWVAILNENYTTNLILLDSFRLYVPTEFFACQETVLADETRGPPSIS